MTGPSPEAIAAARAGGALPASPTYSILALVPSASPRPTSGAPGRRLPTPDEIARINAALSSMDRSGGAATREQIGRMIFQKESGARSIAAVAPGPPPPP
jgi:hypothetical protein